MLSHFNSLVGTNTSDWLESCGVKTTLSNQSLHLAHSIYIFHSELRCKINVIVCVVLGIAVSRLMLRLKAKELANDPEFKASLGWYRNWKRGHSLSLRTKTTLAQRLPYDLENKILQFLRFVIAARQRMRYPLAKIFNMDETPMQFKLPSSPLLLQKSIYTFAQLLRE